MTFRHPISDRRSAGLAAGAVVAELGLAPGGLRDALQEALREAAYKAAKVASIDDSSACHAGSCRTGP